MAAVHAVEIYKESINTPEDPPPLVTETPEELLEILLWCVVTRTVVRLWHHFGEDKKVDLTRSKCAPRVVTLHRPTTPTVEFKLQHPVRYQCSFDQDSLYNHRVALLRTEQGKLWRDPDAFWEPYEPQELDDGWVLRKMLREDEMKFLGDKTFKTRAQAVKELNYRTGQRWTS